MPWWDHSKQSIFLITILTINHRDFKEKTGDKSWDVGGIQLITNEPYEMKVGVAKVGV